MQHMDAEWLQEQVSGIRCQQDGENVRIVVITHHAPVCIGSSNPENAHNEWSCAFATDLLDGSSANPLKNTQVWIFGHIHYTTSMRVGAVKVISNQRGYVLPWQNAATSPWGCWQHLDRRCRLQIRNRHLYDPSRVFRI